MSRPARICWPWPRRTRTRAGHLRASEAAFPGWVRVTHNRAETRGQGYPMAQWDAHDGELKHYPGHDVDMMYLRFPFMAISSSTASSRPRWDARSG